MDVTRRSILAASGTGVVLAGCLGEDEDPDERAATDDEPADDGSTADPDATVQLSAHDEYGDILVGPDGMTLYNFDADEQGAGESSCDDDCAEDWPPLTVTDEPVAGDGVTAELTGFDRGDGETQVAANGWPLYYFTPDDEPGDATGQGVNDVWWVLDPDGIRITAADDADEDGATDDADDRGGDDGPGY